ncbi:MAG: hypothetical protein E7461_05975 [Ruminococcaceae bacterium]|nr:hypothetical protein [Oscillospiraceae bacterium]
MAIKFDTEKSKEAFSSFLKKTSEVGKNVADGVQKGATELSEKMKEDSYQRRLKKYNPLFTDEYNSVDFRLPKLIIIIDATSRQQIDVCEGALGWRDRESDTEVLCLYNDSLKLGNIEFFPNAVCDAAYYVDTFNPNRYIRVDCIFEKAHDERLAELKNIAYMLGAKRCTIEITEEQFERASASNNAGMNISRIVGAKAEQATTAEKSNIRSSKISAVFEGNSSPRRPELKWFAQDDTIKKLIEMRCKKTNKLNLETLQLYGATSATMTQKAATSIDSALSKLKIKGNASMQSNAQSEHSRKIIFSVEFE